MRRRARGRPRSPRGDHGYPDCVHDLRDQRQRPDERNLAAGPELDGRGVSPGLRALGHHDVHPALRGADRVPDGRDYGCN
jgi:hypothetical protein